MLQGTEEDNFNDGYFCEPEVCDNCDAKIKAHEDAAPEAPEEEKPKRKKSKRKGKK